MRFVLTTGWEDGLANLLHRLVTELAAGKQVVWLVSGGSNIPASAKVMDNISPDLRKNLTIILGDERYGPVNHPDSNCLQLREAGFSTAHATAFKTLQPDMSLEDTTERYGEIIEAAFDKADCIIAQLGMGDDGHLAGILPGSPASKADKAMVYGYRGKPFDRITLGFAGLRKVTAAFVFAFGEPKRTALQNLKRKRLPLTEQPAQILKQLPEVYVYNDQVGD